MNHTLKNVLSQFQMKNDRNFVGFDELILKLEKNYFCNLDQWYPTCVSGTSVLKNHFL